MFEGSGLRVEAFGLKGSSCGFRVYGFGFGFTRACLTPEALSKLSSCWDLC